MRFRAGPAHVTFPLLWKPPMIWNLGLNTRIAASTPWTAATPHRHCGIDRYQLTIAYELHVSLFRAASALSNALCHRPCRARRCRRGRRGRRHGIFHGPCVELGASSCVIDWRLLEIDRHGIVDPMHPWPTSVSPIAIGPTVLVRVEPLLPTWSGRVRCLSWAFPKRRLQRPFLWFLQTGAHAASTLGRPIILFFYFFSKTFQKMCTIKFRTPHLTGNVRAR